MQKEKKKKKISGSGIVNFSLGSSGVAPSASSPGVGI
jgi:hypothetical protein